MPRNRHRTDENGHLIVLDNSERCRDCGGDDRNKMFQDVGPDGFTVLEQYAQCYHCDPDRGLYEIKEEEK